MAVRVSVRVVRHRRPTRARIELFANPARRDGLRAVVDDDGELIGFFNFVRERRRGADRARHPARPHGPGLGAQFIDAGLRYASEEWAPRSSGSGSPRGTSARCARTAAPASARCGRGRGQSRFVEMERPA